MLDFTNILTLLAVLAKAMKLIEVPVLFINIELKNLLSSVLYLKTFVLKNKGIFHNE